MIPQKKVRYLNETGRKIFQARSISLSYRRRGRVPRTQTNTNATKVTFTGNIRDLSLPLRKRSTKSLLINSILAYSARKKRANPPLLYSVLNPETNSDSPSAKSKGVRLVSARLDAIQTIARGKERSNNHWFTSSRRAKLRLLIRIRNLSKVIANLTS